LQPSKHASRVVNGLEEMAWRLTTSIPSTPQNLPALEDGAAVDEVEVVDEIMVEDVEESLDTDMLDEVMDNVELISVDIVVGIKATLLELRLLEV
jgi:hypothetical protein